jgi:serine/threonine-protein kinase
MNPDRIGPYQILEKIGSGGMGNVYLGQEADTGRVVAVKVLTATLAREQGFVDRFNREIDAMRKLKNPHIVALFGSGLEGENYFYAMEYVAGETLMSLLRRERRLPWRRAFEISIDVCQALKAAHDAGIIHRDLKPSNLLITPDGFIKLTDFGVAQVFASNRLTVTGGIIGTAEYMSPEQAQGKRAGKQSDLYSLGAVLYAMITGRTPFSGTTAIEVIQKHKFGVFDRPRMYVPDLPNRVDETICRLLEKEPEKRFPDALVLLRHLEQTMNLEDYAAGATVAAGASNDDAVETVPEMERPRTEVGSASGPATLMQSLMRAELSQALGGGLLSAIFNNTFVLLVLLALVIAGGVWFMRTGTVTDSDEVTRPKSEAKRMLQLARHYRQAGDVRRAERMLVALSSLLEGNPHEAELRKEVLESLERVRRQLSADDGRNEMLQAGLDRAAKLAGDGTVEEARKIWNGIIELYGDDPSAREFVRQAEHELHSRESN